MHAHSHSPILVLNCVQLWISFILTVKISFPSWYDDCTAAGLHWPATTYAPQRLIDFWKFDQFQCVLSQLGVRSWAAPAYLIFALCKTCLILTLNSKSGHHLSFPLKVSGKILPIPAGWLSPLLFFCNISLLRSAYGELTEGYFPVQHRCKSCVTPRPAAVSNWYLWNISTLHWANPFNVPSFNSFIDKHFTDISNIYVSAECADWSIIVHDKY